MNHRAGTLRIAPELIGEMLRLPDENRVVDAYMTGDGYIALIIEGPLMPEQRSADLPEQVNLICTVLSRPGDAEVGYQRMVRGHFDHAPEVTWTMKPWEMVKCR